MIQGKTAVKIAARYHNGVSSSALLSFARQGIYFIQYHLKYLQEIECALRPDYNLHPSELTKKAERELNGLKEFIVNRGEHKGIFTEWERSEQYGYMIPYIANDVPDELANKVEVIAYMK